MKCYVDDSNDVILLGELVHLYHFGAEKSDDGKPIGSIVTVKTHKPNWITFPKVTLFNQLSDIAQKMSEGDIIAVTGIVQTNRVVRENKRPEYFETVVGTDIDWYRA